MMDVLLISTYELGRQPFGLASPAAWLNEAGAAVTCNDLAVEPLNEPAVQGAGLIALHLQMHTATRLACQVIDRIRALNPDAHLCFYGLYAPLNEDHLRGLGAATILGGEFEAGLRSLYQRLATGTPNSGAQCEPVISLTKQRFRVPERAGLPPLSAYAYVETADGIHHVAGHTEATRGCKHRCRHCPVVPVYDGRFYVVPRDIVMEDVRRQVAAGARHITFGDPDFFNGIGHAIPLVQAFHAEFPTVSFDATIKIEHLLKHRVHLATLRATGCLFVTTAVESVNDHVLAQIDKGHTRDDFVAAVHLAREADLVLSPTFIPFSPWTTAEDYLALLRLLVELDMVANVAPIQLAIRLLVTRNSRLLELAEIRDHLDEFDADRLSYPWAHHDPRVEDLFAAVNAAVQQGEAAGESRQHVFAHLWHIAHEACGLAAAPPWPEGAASGRPVPHLSEPWYCCAEPTAEQLAAL